MAGHAPHRVAVVGFAHMHAGDQITQVLRHPATELVGVWDTDPARRDAVCDDLGVPAEVRHTDLDRLLEVAAPDLAIVCSTTGEHTELVERLAARAVHAILEKPFALSLAEADRMIAASDAAGTLLAVNWPLAWYPAHFTTQRLIAEGTVGRVTEVHYYDGNRGPLMHAHGKSVLQAPDLATKQASWWYSPEFGGGSLLDYLGYGATLATWFRDGELPEWVSALTWGSEGLAVDEQAVVTASYATGLSTFQTKWGTFSDPWTVQPAPACGFVVVGAEGTITSRDFAPAVHVQTTAHPEPVAVPVDEARPDQTGALAHVIACLQDGTRPTGPSSAETSRKGQQIVDTAAASAASGRVGELLGSLLADGGVRR
ncbi:Gfo/Idh/MocA family oxidoreductase [Kineococcus sp. R8]|uniref:Gfo/Idh/MocA family protein n=1 Tax=Kineococcus siccus TaxID=2696567 RepID=UPI001413311B|nr:Gfo/Idh/MocA family oxidoreductase [Kineococcus siccus]NAZ83194.1 Gfo/Idh/MocA family oxidoreductase [Kineococcus siccus]